MQLMKQTVLIGLILCGLGASSVIRAEVPVVDATTQSDADAATTSAAPETPLPPPTTSSAASARSTDSSASVTSTSSSPSPSLAANASLPMAQRVSQLERQMDNLTQMDLVSRINQLQQQVAKLQGQVELQSHDLKQLGDQVRTQYQDVDQRLSHAAPKQPVNTVSTVSSTTTDGDKTIALKTTTASTVANKPQDPAQEQKDYLAANKLLIKGDYVRATTALQNLLAQYPNGTYAGSAHYWLGEIYLKQGQPDIAVTEFNTVIEHYPKHPKVSDAMLKLGFAYYDKGDWQKARTELTKVKKQFPKSTVAQLASARLEEMKQHGK